MYAFFSCPVENTSAPTFHNVIMPSTPTPPTFTLQLFLESLLSLETFCYFVHFSLLFLIDFIPARPHAGRKTKFAQVKSLRFSELFPGMRISEFRFTVFFSLGCGGDS